MEVSNAVIERELLDIISQNPKEGINKEELLIRLAHGELKTYIDLCLLNLVEQRRIEVTNRDENGDIVYRSKKPLFKADKY